MMKQYIFVGIGGMIGTLLRYSLTLFIGGSFLFPWETLIANVTGAFILTLLLLSQRVKKAVSTTIHTALTVGLLGSYTTFSAVTVEVLELMKDQIGLALIYVVISVVGGLISCYFAYLFVSRRQVL